MNKVWFDESLKDAVDDPRVHEELVPSMDVEIEKKKKYRLNRDIVKGLEDLGHKVVVGNDAAFRCGTSRISETRGRHIRKVRPEKIWRSFGIITLPLNC